MSGQQVGRRTRHPSTWREGHRARSEIDGGPRLSAVKIGVILPVAQADGPGETPSWPTIRSFAQAAEARDLDSVWMFDYFFDRSDAEVVQGKNEAWTIVSAAAAVTQRIQIGTLVLCTSFRSPGLVAKMAVTADDVSDGRLILGLGAGWHDAEFEAFGYPKDHRLDRFEEALRIIAPLLRGESVSITGRYHEARDAVLAPAADPHRRGGTEDVSPRRTPC